MRISRLTAEVLILGIAYLLLLGVFMFGTGNQYYYRTIAGVLSSVLLLTFVYLIRTRSKANQSEPSKNSPKHEQTPSMRINVILAALGSFLLGATGGILIYDSYWGLNDILFKRSISF